MPRNKKIVYFKDQLYRWFITSAMQYHDAMMDIQSWYAIFRAEEIRPRYLHNARLLYAILPDSPDVWYWLMRSADDNELSLYKR